MLAITQALLGLAALAAPAGKYGRAALRRRSTS